MCYWPHAILAKTPLKQTTSTILHVIVLAQSTIVLQLMAARSFFDIQTSSKTLRHTGHRSRVGSHAGVWFRPINEIVMEYRCNRMKHQRGCRRIDWSYCLLSGQRKHRKHWQHLIIGPPPRREACLFISICRRIVSGYSILFTQECSLHLLKIHQIHILQTWSHHGSRVHWRELGLPALVFLLLRVQWSSMIFSDSKKDTARIQPSGFFQIHWN